MSSLRRRRFYRLEIDGFEAFRSEVDDTLWQQKPHVAPQACIKYSHLHNSLDPMAPFQSSCCTVHFLLMIELLTNSGRRLGTSKGMTSCALDENVDIWRGATSRHSDERSCNASA